MLIPSTIPPGHQQTVSRSAIPLLMPLAAQVPTPTRRDAVATVAGALLLLNGSRAHAFLGIGEPSSEDVYKADTVRLGFSVY